MPVYSGMYGTCYTTGKTLGSGGEGTIYSLTGHGNLVAKIYNSEKFHNGQERKQMERKLKTMRRLKKMLLMWLRLLQRPLKQVMQKTLILKRSSSAAKVAEWLPKTGSFTTFWLMKA